MTTLLLGIGMVFVIEGLVLALAPSYYEQIVAALSEMTVEQRRLVGLAGAAFGVFVVWLAM